MKKTLFTFMALAMAFAVTSCQSEEKLPLEEPSQEPTNVSITGTAMATINGMQVDVKWVQLWAGGPKFAEFNVGAASRTAEDYGGYYCWGSSIDKDSNGAYKSGTDALTGDSDIATALWGSNWRMPTKAELQGLIDNCNVEFTTVGGVNGCKFTGKGAYVTSSVFLPAAGYYEGNAHGQGDFGRYWPSTPDDSYFAYCLNLSSRDHRVDCHYPFFRNCGLSVRAVLAVNTDEPEDGIVFVDLGLPSGTKWAACNYGASIPTECGSCILFDSIPDGTPTQSEWEELFNNCGITSNGDGSVKISHPDTYDHKNDFIILPLYGGYYRDGDYCDTDTRYWFCNSLGYDEQRMISVYNYGSWSIPCEYIGYTFKCFVRQVQRPQ